ncbi:MAG: hypothetical protein RLZZ369_397 [Pseudomonadota bacterium]|jgi:uncharacterized GH25 family protein|nr:hypothetical protein [Aquabacterium sp.]MCC7545858.1 hypothetical protein [Aquabacterium sp.]
MKKPLITRLLTAVGCMTLLSTAQAHYLWIERIGTQATLSFGEFEESAREQSPGRLDEIPNPQAQVLTDQSIQDVRLQKQRHGFAFPALQHKATALWVTESTVGVKDWTRSGMGVVKPYFYARNQTKVIPNAAPALVLDILPLHAQGQFRVYFRGAPLPKATVKIIAPNSWALEGHTNQDGVAQLPLPWRGQYILQVIHSEPLSGEYEGKTYQTQRHRATLTYTENRGPRTFAPQPAPQP